MPSPPSGRTCRRPASSSGGGSSPACGPARKSSPRSAVLRAGPGESTGVTVDRLQGGDRLLIPAVVLNAFGHRLAARPPVPRRRGIRAILADCVSPESGALSLSITVRRCVGVSWASAFSTAACRTEARNFGAILRERDEEGKEAAGRTIAAVDRV